MRDKMSDRDGRNGRNGTAPEREPRRAEPEDGARALRLLAAQMLLVTGVVSTVDTLTRAREPRPGIHPDQPLDFASERDGIGALAASWAPAMLAPLAAVAHLLRGPDSSSTTSAATRVLDVAVVGAGLAGLVGAMLSTRRRGGIPSLTPVMVASAGVLGLMLDREEQRWQEERARLRRRASVVARLVPKRRARLDRIVLHV